MVSVVRLEHICVRIFCCVVSLINSHHILVKLAYLNYLASFIPFSRVGSSLVLDADMVAIDERW